MAAPKKNSLWSRKDARRPGVVKVVRISNLRKGGGWYSARYVCWEDIHTGRQGDVLVDEWPRRYRPYTAPTQGTPTAPPDEQEK